MRIAGISTVLLLLALGLAGVSVGQDEPAFRFSVMGDNRPQAGQPDIITQNQFYKTNIAEVNRLDPDFVVVIGDLIMGYTPDKALLVEMWDAFDEANKLFTVPFRLCVGNHDVFDLQSQELYKERYGDLWYSFDHEGCHFIVLDSDYYEPDGSHFEGITGDQIEWLKADLEEHKDARRIYAFLHKPFWRYSDEQSNWNKEVHPLLAQYGVDTVFAGHWHQYEHDGTKDGVRYIVTGGAGAEIGENPPIGDFYHHLFCTVRGNETKIAVIESGKILDEKVVTREMRESGEKIGQAIKKNIHTVPVGSSEAQIKLAVENPYSLPMKAALAWDTAGTGWSAEPPTEEVEIAPGDKFDASFDLKATGGRQPGSGTPTYKITCDVEGFRGPLVFSNTVYFISSGDCPKVASPPSIDGSLDDWGPPAFHIGSGSAFEPPEAELTWGGEADLSCDVYLAWDDTNLYIGAKVTDDAFFNSATTPVTLYNGDSILVGIDTGQNCRDPENKSLGSVDQDDILLGAGLLGGSPATYCFLKRGVEAPIEGLQFSAKQAGSNTLYELAVPWESIEFTPSAETTFGFSLRVDEDDSGAGREARLGWGLLANPVSWGDVTLTE
jgi:hypothetical protein